MGLEGGPRKREIIWQYIILIKKDKIRKAGSPKAKLWQYNISGEITYPKMKKKKSVNQLGVNEKRKTKDPL